MPKRIQRKRTKGWRMPPNTVSVCRPGKFGNPFIAGRPMLYGNEWIEPKDNSESVWLFRRHIEQQLKDFPDTTQKALDQLRGKDLACWCKEGAVCHGDVLLELANK